MAESVKGETRHSAKDENSDPKADPLGEGNALIVIPTSVCSVCNQEKESCIILSTHCRH